MGLKVEIPLLSGTDYRPTGDVSKVHLLQLWREQKKDTAMGSPVSAVVANLYMECIEELALEMPPTRLRLWKRHVDDTFGILRKGSTEELLCHLNESGQPSSSLWSRKKTELPFLNTLLRRREDGSLDVFVYRKAMYTDRSCPPVSRLP